MGETPTARQSAYRALSKARISEHTLAEIRQATKKAWVLGDGYFAERIEQQMNRLVSPKTGGGDRRSKAYKEMNIFNRV